MLWFTKKEAINTSGSMIKTVFDSFEEKNILGVHLRTLDTEGREGYYIKNSL